MWSFDENKTANITSWLLELFCCLFVCLKCRTNTCHRQNPWILLDVCHKNTIGSNFNSKVELVENLVSFPFEVPFSLNSTLFFGLNMLKVLMKSHIKLFKIEPSTKRGRRLQSIDSGIARDGKKIFNPNWWNAKN